MAETVYLISCTQQKIETDEEVPARELYTASPWFRHARSIAEARAADRWYILSAWYGVLTPDAHVRTYNAYLGQYGKDMRRKWARSVWATLSAANVSGARVVVLAGEKYCEHLLPFMRQAGCIIERPMEGLKIGEQLSWLKREAGIIEAEARNPYVVIPDIGVPIPPHMETMCRRVED